MAVNENRWETIGEERRQRHLPHRTLARVTTPAEWLFTSIPPFTSREIVLALHDRTYHSAPNLSAKFRGEFNAAA
jgi:hypothetical protein